MAKGKAGRPSKFDKATGDRIVEAMRSGAWLYVAAQHVGIATSTLREWMRKGKERPTSEYGDFRRKVMKATAAAEILIGAKVYEAAIHDPTIGIAWLRIRHRKRWSERQRLELTGKDGGAVKVDTTPDLSGYTDDELETLEKIEAAAESRRAEKGKGPA